MNGAPRKRSPRAPSMSLEEALDRALKAYDCERLHPAPTEVVAQHLGYKSANSGTALSAIASLSYFGLLERPTEGMLAVSKLVESYKYAPDEELRKGLLLRFVQSPTLYSELLEKYQQGLPSEANLRYELIQKGFAPAAADQVLVAFIKSIQFVGYYNQELKAKHFSNAQVHDAEERNLDVADIVPASERLEVKPSAKFQNDQDLERIPVRLQGGRRAWLHLPTTLYQNDKARLKAQIDLILAEDE